MGACANKSCSAASAYSSWVTPSARATNSRFGRGGGAPTQAMCGCDSFCHPPMRHAVSATAKAAICTQRPSISNPWRLSPKHCGNCFGT